MTENLTLLQRSVIFCLSWPFLVPELAVNDPHEEAQATARLSFDSGAATGGERRLEQHHVAGPAGGSASSGSHKLAEQRHSSAGGLAS